MAGQSQSAFSHLYINGYEYCFSKIEDQTVYKLTDSNQNSMCGRLYHVKERVTTGIIVPRLHIFMEPTPEELDRLLPLIGFSENADVFSPISDFSTLTSFDVLLDRVASVDTYADGILDKGIFRFQKGTRPWSLELQMVFQSQPTIDAGGTTTTPSAWSSKTAPYAFHEGSVLTLSGGSKVFQSGVLVIDNHVAIQHNNSQYPTSVRPTFQTFNLGTDTPYTSDEVDLLTDFTGEADASPANTTSVAGFSGSLKFARSDMSTTFTFHNLKLLDGRPPSIPLKEEIRLQSFFEAFGSGATPPMTITNDITTTTTTAAP